jgi:hypothetical protein
VKNWNCGAPCIPFVSDVTLIKNSRTGADGFVAYNKHHEEIIISFRGTENPQEDINDLITDAKINTIENPYLPREIRYPPSYVHAGFVNAFGSVRY